MVMFSEYLSNIFFMLTPFGVTFSLNFLPMLLIELKPSATSDVVIIRCSLLFMPKVKVAKMLGLMNPLRPIHEMLLSKAKNRTLKQNVLTLKQVMLTLQQVMLTLQQVMLTLQQVMLPYNR